jgi:hypothetical protein
MRHDRHHGTALSLALLALLVVPGTALAADGDPRTPHFVDVTRGSGLRHVYAGQHAYVGGGVAVLDCDEDGLPDLYLAGADGPATLWRNRTRADGAIRLRRLEAESTDLPGVFGAYPLDIDSDGHQDLVVLRDGEDVILRGLGGCTFERANESLGFDGGTSWDMAFSATWESGSSLPTLAIGSYVDMTGMTEGDDLCPDDRLFRPSTAGDGYASPVALSPSYCALSMLFSDWDASGRRDLRITNDRQYYRAGSDLLWRVEPDSDPSLYTEADGWASLQLNGMGIASADLTGDGHPEYYLTSQGDNKLQTLADGTDRPEFTDIALERGVTSAQPFTGGDTRPSTAWHPEFQDVNSDGLVDLFVSKGNLGGVEGFALKDPDDLFLQRADGTLLQRARQAGLLDYGMGRGAALVDLDRDGLLDLVEVRRDKRVKVMRNLGASTKGTAKPLGHWLGISLAQPAPNRDAIGAWIEITTGDRVQTRELTVGGGHAGGQAGPIHVGLGSATEAQVRVRWPDGAWSDAVTVAADRYLVVDRDAGPAPSGSPAAGS